MHVPGVLNTCNQMVINIDSQAKPKEAIRVAQYHVILVNQSR